MAVVLRLILGLGIHVSTSQILTLKALSRQWVSSLKSQVVLLQTAHSWANAGVVLGARMHRERGSFRSN